jgi:hypothetical protein
MRGWLARARGRRPAEMTDEQGDDQGGHQWRPGELGESGQSASVRQNEEYAEWRCNRRIRHPDHGPVAFRLPAARAFAASC